MNKNKIISPITYYGAKSSLSEWIISFFPKHVTFVEVFGGSGIITLRKEPSLIEVYNDIDRMIADLFLVLKGQITTELLRHQLLCTPYSRDEFLSSKNVCEGSILENARRSMVRFNMSYSGNGHFFSTSVKDTVMGIPSCVRRFQRRIDALPAAHDRLKNVIVENQDFRKLIPRYDHPQTLFYLDPPYHMSTRDGKNRYIHEFKKQDHEDLIDILLQIKGSAVISGYACKVYERLEENGFTRHDRESIVRASSVRVKRIESIWVR